ncbi:YadA-like family protein [Halomonas sp. TD01]|uniref:YadA-like family protein n=1 Tax=Halomonas sp. TD01 TaxID=999141 RepID=UPI001E79EF79|nr:YadA-like family protein [Halomonas sp. TD01]CAH1043417.1 hypothetical protein HPTD01_1895 [Halomonas sp. TD01]
MNNVFRLIWNRTLGRLVVTSEAARSRDKAATRQGVVGQLPAPEVASNIPALLRPVVAAVALAVGSITLVSPVQADALMNADSCANQGFNNTRIGIGSGAKACGDGLIAIGWGAEATGVDLVFPPNPDVQSGVAIGRASSATGGVAIGHRAAAGGSNSDGTSSVGTAIGGGSVARGHRSIAIGTVGNRPTVASANWAMALGTNATASEVRSVALGPEAKAKGVGSLAMGDGAVAESIRVTTQALYDAPTSNPNGYEVGDYLPTTAVGAGATANSGTAIGHDAVAGRESGNGDGLINTGTALGAGAQATGNTSIAISPAAYAPAIADGLGAIAVGYDTRANELGSLAIGIRAEAAEAAMAFGYGAKALGKGGSALGGDAKATGNRSVAIGAAEAAKAGDIAIGDEAYAEGGVDGSGNPMSALAVGFGAEAVGEDAAAFGNNAKARANYGLAVGNFAEANGVQASSLGNGAQANGDYSLALGNIAKANGVSASSVGNFAEADGDYSIALGEFSEAGGSRSTAVGSGAKASAENAWASGSDAVASANGAIALGKQSQATVENTVAMGTNAEASATNAIAIGKDSLASGVDTGAIGRGAVATGSWAVGTGANASNGGQAFGEYSTASGNVSSAYGYNATATGNRSSALGTSARAEGVRSVAVGDGALSRNIALTSVALSGTSNPNGYKVGDPMPTVAVGAGSRAVNGTAVGFDAVAGKVVGSTTNSGTAIGGGAQATGNASIAISPAAEAPAIADGLGAVAMGYDARAMQLGSLAIGIRADASEYGNAFGNRANAGDYGVANGFKANATGERAIAIGTESLASVDDAIAVGTNARATGVDALAIGRDAWAAGSVAQGAVARAANGGAAFGDGAQATWREDNDPNENPETFDVSGAALGKNALANRSGATALGANTEVLVDDGVALGSGSISTVGPGVNGYIPATADAAQEQAILDTAAVRGAVDVGSRQITSVAAGTQDDDAVNVSQLKAVETMAAESGVNYYSVQDDGTPEGNFNNDGATGWKSLAAGTNASATKDHALAVGDGAQAIGFEAMAIGREAVASGPNSSIAIGQLAKATQDFAISIGRSSEATAQNAVALGNGALARVEQGVALGSGSLSTVGAGVAGFVPAGADAADEQAILDTIATRGSVDIGSRQITRVAAGTKDGDAVNVAQLKSVNNLAGAGWDVQVNAEVADNVAPGETVQFIDGKNIDITRDGDQIIKVATSDNVEFNQVTIGDATNNTVITSTVDGLDVGGDKITNVADGEISNTSSDAVNGSQLFATNTNVDNNTTNITNNTTEIGKGINFGDGATANNYALGDTINVKGDPNVTSTTTADGVQLGLADVVNIGSTNPVTIDGNSGTIGGLTNKTFDPNNFTSGQAASEDQLSQVTSDLTTEGLDFAGNEGADVHRDLGQTLAIQGEATSGGAYTGANLKTVTDPLTGAINLQMTDSPDFTNVNVTNQLDVAGDTNIGGNTTIQGDTTVKGDTFLGDNFSVVNNEAIYNVEPDQITNDYQVTNKKYVDNSVTALGDTPLTFMGDSGTQFDRKLGETANVKGGSIGTLTDGNIGVVADGTDTLNIKLAENVDLGLNGSVVMGDTTVNNDGLTVGDTIVNGDSITTNNLTVSGETKLGDNFVVNNEGNVSYTGDIIDGNNIVNKDYVDGKETHYYSVNDGGTIQGNYENDGATGVNAMAAGVKAVATGLENTAIGFNTQATGSNRATAVGANALASAPGTTSLGGFAAATGISATAIGTRANASGLGSSAIGSNAKASGLASVALGQLSMAAGEDSVAVGSSSSSGYRGVSVGRQTETSGENGTATGFFSRANGDYAAAYGSNSKASGDFSLAMGASSEATAENSVALGAGSVADGSTLGTAAYQPLDINGNPIAVAAPSAASEVSVGSAGNERRITNVAAGATDTDAVNVSQLKAVNEVANTGWNVQANGDVATNVAPGDTVQMIDGKNIAITRDGKDITVATADDVEFTNVDVTENLNVAGNTTIEGDTTVKGDTFLGDNFSVVNNEAIYNVEPDQIINDYQVTNKKYVDNSVTALGDTPLTFGDDAGTTTDRKLGERLDVVTSNANLSTTLTDEQTLEIAMSDDLDVNNVTVNDSLTVNGPTTLNGGTTIGDSLTLLAGTTVDMGGNQITNVAAGTEGDHAVNLDQLTDVSDVANKGWNVQTNGDVATNVAPGDTVQMIDGKNIAITRDGKDITVATADDVEFTNVDVTENLNVAGNTTIEGDTTVKGDTFLGDNFSVVNNEAIYNVEPDQIINDYQVTNKKYVDNSVTALGDTPLTFMGDSGTQFDRKLGETANVKGGNTGTLTDGNIGVVADGTDTLNIKLAENVDLGLNGSVVMGDTTVNNDGLTIAGGPSITNTGIDAGNTTITNVAPGVDGTDAVNVDQLTNVSDVANKGWNVQANGDVATNVAPGDTVQMIDGKNIAITRDGKDITVATADDVEFTNVDVTENLNVAGNTTIEGDTTVKGDTFLGDNFSVVNNEAIYNVEPDQITNDYQVTNKKYVDNSVTALGDTPLTFMGDSGTQFDRKLGETANVKGGSIGTLTDGNIGVVADGTDTLNIKLAENVDLGLNGSVVMGDTTVNNDGLTIAGGPSITNTGIDAGNTTITNVAPGVDGTDAVNVDQLTNVSDVANKGWNVQTNGDVATNVAPGDTVQMIDGKNIAITRDGKDITVATADDVEFTNVDVTENLNVAGDTAIGGNTTIAGNTTIEGDTTVKGDTFLGDNFSVVNNEAIYNVEPDQITNDYQVVNKKYVTQAGDDLIDNNPLTFGDDAGTTTDRKLGERLDVVTSNANLSTTLTDEQTLEIAMSDDLDINNVTVNDSLTVNGPTTLNGGTTIGDSLTLLAGTTVDMGGNQITNVAAGTEGDHAVNLDQLTDVSDVANKGWNVQTNGDVATNVAPGDTVQMLDGKNIAITRDGKDITVATADDVEFTNVDVTENLNVAGDTNIAGDTIIGGNTTINENLTVEGDTYLGDSFSIVNNEAFYDGPVTEDNHITNKSYVDNSVTELGDTPLTFGANEGDDTDRRLGDRLDIVGEEDAEGDSNIITKITDEETLELALNDDLKIGNSITVGDTFIDGDSVTTNNMTVNENLTVQGETRLGDNFFVNNEGNVTYTGDITEGDHITNKSYVDNSVTELGDTPLTFAGDSGTPFERRLGETTNVKGGAEGGLTEGNIGVVADGEDTLNIQLAENIDLGEDGSLTINETLIDGNQVTTNNVTVNETLTVEGDTFLNENLTVAGNTTINENLTVEGDTYLGDSFSIVNNEAFYDGPVTEDNHITNKSYVDNSVTELGDTPLTFGANEGDDTDRRLGDRLDIVGEEDAEGDSNIITKITDEETLELALNDDLKIGNSITVGDTFIDGDSVTTNNMTVNENLTVQGETRLGDNFFVNNEGNVTYTGDITEGDHITNKDYVDNSVTELGDTPLTFAGDSGESFERRLGEQTNVKGGSEGGLTEGNIGVVADGEDTLNIQLAENIDLGEDGSLTINETLIDGNQVTTNNVTVNETLTVEGDTFLNENLTVAGNTTINENLTVEGDTYLGDSFSIVNNEAFYDGPVTEDNHITNKSYVDNSVTELGDTPLTFGANEGDDTDRRLGDRLDIVGEEGAEGDSNIITKITDEETLELALNDDLKIGNSITVGDTFIDGDSVTTNNMTVNENLTVEGETRLGDNFFVNNEGNVTYTGDITEGDHITNKSYVDNSVTELGDTPLTFAGDSGTPFERRLGETTNVKGGAEGGLTEGNIGVVADGEDTLNIQLAENIDLGEDGSLTINETLIDGNQVTTNNVTVNETLTVEGDTFLNENLTVAGNTTINENLTVEGDTYLGDSFSIVNNEAFYDGPVTEDNHITNKSYVDNSVTELGDTPLTFGANEGDDTDRRLGDRLDIVGEEGAEGDSNIITKITDEETLELALNDDLKIGNSITVGDTFIDGDSVTTNNMTVNENLTVEGDTFLNENLTVAGNTTINENLTVEGTTQLGDNFFVTNEGNVTYDGDITEGNHITNKSYVDNSVTELGDTPLTFGANEGDDTDRRLGDRLDIVGEADEEGNSNIITKLTDEETLELALNDDLKIGNSITVGDTFIDGDSITTNNMTVNENLTVAGETRLGDNFIVTNEGNVTYTGDITEGNHIVNKDYVDGGIDELGDRPIYFAGDTGEKVAKRLRETLTISGELAEDADATGANLRIDSDSKQLNLVMAKNLTDLESITLGDTFISNEGITLGDTTINGARISSNNLTVTGETKLGDNFFANNDGNVTYTGDITEGTHIVNKDYVDGAGDQLIANNPLTFGANEGEDTERRLGDRLDIVGEADEEGTSNIITKLTDEQTLELALNDDLKIGNSIAVGEDGPVISGDGIDMGDNKITNVADGSVSADSKDAINGSQLYQLESIVTNVTGDISNEYVTNNGRGIRYVRTNDSGLAVSDAFAQGQGSTAVGYEAVASADRALAMGYDAIASHQGSVALGEGARTAEAVSTASIEIAGQTYQFAGASPVATVSVGSVGAERTVTNVAAGRVSAESTDAINGSQLYATNQAVGALDNRVTNVEGDISNITNDLADLDDRAVKYDRSDDGSVDYNTITLEGDGGTKITNVAPGDIAQNSSDAVNGSQLWDVQNQITDIEQGGSKYFRANSEGPVADPQGADSIAMGSSSVAAGDRSVASGAGAQANAEGSVALGADSVADREGMNGERERFSNESVASTQGAVSVGSEGNERQITNVAGGTQDTDAVNVRQLDAVQRGAVNYDRDEDGNVDYSTITLKGDEGTTITNVAPGINANDAANVGQLNDLGRRFENEIINVHGRIDSVERNANAGSASAIAASTVPQAWMPGKSMVGVGAGTYGGESAVSVGVSRLSDNGRWVIQGKVTGDSQSNFGAGIGAGWHW